MKRKLCALLLALGMIVSFAAAAGAAAFADVPGGSWYAAGVSLAAEKGIMTGTGETTFSPRRPVSWAQAITIAARLHAQNTGKSVPAAGEEEAWYAPALAYARTNALLPPDCPEDEAALTGPLSRRSLAYLLAKSTPQPLQTINDGQLTDIDALSADEQAAIRTVAAGGVMAGKSGGLFDPEGRATRAELAVTVARLLDPALRTAQDRSRQNISDDTLGNFTTGGIADEASDGYTYCLVDGWYKKDIGETSYVLRRDKTGAQTVLWSTLDYRLKDICLYDDYLYMRGGRMKEPYGETVMRIPKTGGEPEILYKNTLGIETYTFYDGQLYILEMSSKPENYKNWSYRICRVENGQAKQIGRGLNFDQALFTDVLYGFGGKLYFIRDESSSCGLYAIDLETDKQELIYDGNFEEAVFYDNKLYFIPWDNHNYGHAFYRLSLTGGEPELLFDIPQAATQSIALRCYHNTFYLVGRTSKAVWRFGMDGSLTQVASILTGLCQTLSFFDDQLVISVDEPQGTATEDNMLWSLSQPGGTPSIFIDWFRLPGEVRPAE